MKKILEKSWKKSEFIGDPGSEGINGGGGGFIGTTGI